MIKFHWSNSKLRWKDSVTVSLALLATLQTIAEVSGFLDLDCINSIPWLRKLAIIFAIFIFLTVCTFISKHLLVYKGLKLSIGDNEVKIKQADIFEQDWWRLIPFNEMFDTVVDDIIIAHHSLNGYFIDTTPLQNSEGAALCFYPCGIAQGEHQERLAVMDCTGL